MTNVALYVNGTPFGQTTNTAFNFSWSTNTPGYYTFVAEKKRKEKVSVNGIAIFLLEAQEAAWLANYECNIRVRFITS